jgi:hypothetical protein
MHSKNQSNSFSDKSNSKLPSKVSSNSERIILPPSLTTSGTYIVPVAQNITPLKSSVKKSPVFEAQKEPVKPVELKEEVEQGQRENE